MEGMSKYSIQTRVEKDITFIPQINSNINFLGLQSQNLADILTTIIDCAHYIREYPFPGFVHNILFKLAQAFQGELFGRKHEQSLNLIRLRIVTAIRECNSSFGNTFSTEEIVRCIMKVSHSNDYKARSLTLLFFASLGPLIFDNKKVHNLVIESLDSAEQTELSAALQAANELAKHSLPFSALVVHKSAELLGASHTDHSVRVELLRIISNLRDLSLANQCLRLGKDLLESSDHKMHAVVYCSLTKLASRAEHIISEQIDLLLDGLNWSISHKDKALIYCIFVNLSKLANFSQCWKREHVLTILNCYPQIDSMNSKIVLCTWLWCLQSLSFFETIHQIMIEKHLIWMSLLESDDFLLRIHAINLVLNFVQKNDSAVELLQPPMFDAIIRTLSEYQKSLSTLTKDLAKSPIFANPLLAHKFFALVATFVRGSSCSVSMAKSLAKNLLDYGQLLLLPSSKFVLELLAVINDTFWDECRDLVFTSLISSIACPSTDSLAHVPQTVFSLLFSSSPFNCLDIATNPCPQLSAVITRLEQSDGVDHWRLYQLARSALRYGHWRRLALPLLQRIQKSTENLEIKSWLAALTHLANSQLAAFSTDEFERAEAELQQASTCLESLTSSEKDQPFWFVAAYVTSLLSFLKSIHFLVKCIDAELSNAEQAMEHDGEPSERSLARELSEAQKKFGDVRHQWVALCGKSFDADIQTLLQMSLLSRICLLLEQYLEFLSTPKKERPILSEIKIEDLGESGQNSVPCANIRNLYTVLNRMRLELLDFHSGLSRPDIQACLLKLREMLLHLTNFPLGLPRFFFQRLQYTKIKLIISPQPTDLRGIYRVSSMDLLPVIIEGIIESNNRKPIESVCVVLTLRRDNTAPTEKRQQIQLEQGDKYFKAQFLLKLVHQKPTKISAKVYFVDSVTKKQWYDESDTATLTVELADGVK